MRDYRGDEMADYTAAIAFTQRFAWRLLTGALPHDVDTLKISIPADATPSTPWRLTRLSCRSLVWRPPDRANDQGLPRLGLVKDTSQIEPDSDVWAVKMDRVISVTPLSLDLTSRADLAAIDRALSGTSTDQGVIDNV